ncbi:hypothetical protein GIB67_020340 [Kingdonia uniflora]|uniref:Sister chromatid cohesion protein n=1 Tax=Kingdonia uniflora TaxID=39325 RepID=A0A7J7LRE0_9MAGN|nr:hypothetical protein GIB67_020340 [Kingdonia uniflora]
MKRKVFARAQQLWCDSNSKYRKLNYDPYPNDEGRRTKCPKRVRHEDWEIFLELQREPRVIARRERGKAARKAMKRPHTSGRRGSGRIDERLRKKNPKVLVFRPDVYLVAHTRVDRSSLTPELDVEFEKIRNICIVEPGIVSLDIDSDPIAQVYGKSTKGRIRECGLNVSREEVLSSYHLRNQLLQEKTARLTLEEDLFYLRLIVEVVLRQGLVHPKTCVPYLIALETDAQEVKSKLSHHFLLSMNEKHLEFFESRLGDGLQMSFNFIHSLVNTSLEYSNQGKPSGNMKEKSDGNNFVHARLGVSRIYWLIWGNRVSRNKFVSSVLKVLIPSLRYYTEILASLPFTSPDEPLYLIYAINCVLQVRSGSIEATMKDLSSRSIQEDKHIISYKNGVLQHDFLVLQHEPYSPTHSVFNHIKEEDAIMCSPTLGVSCGILKDNLQSIQADCQAAIAWQLLLKLKRHLKIAFGLSDARYQEFLPNDPQKLGEALSRQNIPFDISETYISLPTSHKEIIERYQGLV